ncbi:MAG: hypothetical protein Q8N30_04155 [Methylococcales bacterium]|nr:hypothetical protein [Methylococcales bacterium]
MNYLPETSINAIRFKETAKWSGTVLFMVGSFLISAVPSLGMVWWPFFTFFVGHILWSIAGIMMKDRAVLALNIMYLPIDVYAICIRLFN